MFSTVMWSLTASRVKVFFFTVVIFFPFPLHRCDFILRFLHRCDFQLRPPKKQFCKSCLRRKICKIRSQGIESQKVSIPLPFPLPTSWHSNIDWLQLLFTTKSLFRDMVAFVGMCCYLYFSSKMVKIQVTSSSPLPPFPHERREICVVTCYLCCYLYLLGRRACYFYFYNNLEIRPPKAIVSSVAGTNDGKW